MDKVQELYKAEARWDSSVGACYPGRGAEFRGFDMFKKFSDWNWLSMFYFAATGKELSNNAEKFINGLYSMCFSYPDSRIWNNGVAAFAGTARSTMQLGVCAASAVSEATFYGGPPVMKSLDFLLRAKSLIDSGSTLEEIEQHEKDKNKFVYGYGRPVVSEDERIKPAIKLLKELDLFDRAYMQLALQIEDYLKQKNDEIGLNIGGVFAAFCADEGMSPNELYSIMVVCFSVGMIACYIDTLDKPEGHYFPLQCQSIKYSGQKTRNW